jgi:hypothetical protein
MTKTNVSPQPPVINVEKLLVETPPAFLNQKIGKKPINYNGGKLIIIRPNLSSCPSFSKNYPVPREVYSKTRYHRSKVRL